MKKSYMFNFQSDCFGHTTKTGTNDSSKRSNYIK